MTKIEKLEHEIETLSAPELSEFRRWFLDFDAEAWDEQIAGDAQFANLILCLPNTGMAPRC